MTHRSHDMRHIMSLCEAEAEAEGDDETDAEYNMRMSRARGMGFDPDMDWFHGSSRPIDQFDLSLLGSTTGARNTGLGFFFVDDGYTASAYSGKRGTIIDVLLRMRKPMELRQAGDFVDVGDVGHYLDVWTQQFLQLPSYPTEDDYKELRQDLIRRGFDAIIVSMPSVRVAIVFHPQQIRDRNAQFDPAKANSASLLA